MENLNKTLQDFLIIENLTDQEENQEETWQKDLLTSENWKLFEDTSWDYEKLNQIFSGKTPLERKSIFKFGISCLITFVQDNFTGPTLQDEYKQLILEQQEGKHEELLEILALNSEVNVNISFPILLVVSKIIFQECVVEKLINSVWKLRTLIIHQKILDEASSSLLIESETLEKDLLNCLNSEEVSKEIQALIKLELAQLFLQYRHISKVEHLIKSCNNLLKINYNLIGKLGRRTKFQQESLAQLSLSVQLNEEVSRSEIDDSNIPSNIPLEDDVRLNKIAFNEDPNLTTKMSNTEQKLFLVCVQNMLISRPKEQVDLEELNPFLDTILQQKNTFTVRLTTLLIRCNLEDHNRRTIERCLQQCDEITLSWTREQPNYLKRVLDVFGTGWKPKWQVEGEFGTLLLNAGLIKNSLDVFLKIKHWEEVIVCYTIMKLRHKAAEIIKEQLDVKPTVKLWCLLGDATDDISCYEKAWILSKEKSPRAQRHWGNYYYVRKDYENCIPHFERSLSINPLQANILFRLGFAALETKNWNVAASSYRRYTCLEPDSFEAWNNLANVYIQLNSKKLAYQALLEAIKCNFENWKVWANLVVVCCDLGNFLEVVRAYHRVLDHNEKYINMPILTELVEHVLSQETLPETLLSKTRELLGRITGVFRHYSPVWELYASLAPNSQIQVQRLQKAFHGFSKTGTWNSNQTECTQVVKLCDFMGNILVESLKNQEIDKKDPIVNSIRLNLRQVLAVAKKNRFEGTQQYCDNIDSSLTFIEDFVK